MSEGQEITVTLTFRVSDEQRLRELAHAVMDTAAYGPEAVFEVDRFSLDDCAEMVIADRAGPWFGLGLERLDG